VSEYGEWGAQGVTPEPGTRYEFEDFIGARFVGTLRAWSHVVVMDVDDRPTKGVCLFFSDRGSFETNMPIRFREVLA